ncbi:MAG: hypothetical protein KDB80_01340 [Planctomycetes bacterium]|nr:hypothetical protein [Planctomycetota bacterium]
MKRLAAIAFGLALTAVGSAQDPGVPVLGFASMTFGSGCGTGPVSFDPPAGVVFNDGSSESFSVSGLSSSTLASVLVMSAFEGAVDLTAFGMTSCTLYLGPVAATFPMTLDTVGGAATSFPVGPLPPAMLFWQVLVLSPGENPFGIVTSDGLRWDPEFI